MEITEQLKIELNADDTEKIIREYIENQMEQNGYKLDYSRVEESYPDSVWCGVKE